MVAENTSAADIDAMLLKRFEDLAEVMPENVALESSQTDSVKNILLLHFPSFHDDVLLCRKIYYLKIDYACKYVNNDVSTKGRFCISRYTAYFYGIKSDQEAGVFLSLPFKDVTSFDTISSKGILNPDILRIVIANKISVIH
jgi:hypothetical protein